MGDATINEDGRKLMEELYGSSEAVDRAMGRPSVDGTMAPGHSPVRQVRLPRDLDALLTARAEEEHRKRSEVIRDALALYLRKTSSQTTRSRQLSSTPGSVSFTGVPHFCGTPVKMVHDRGRRTRVRPGCSSGQFERARHGYVATMCCCRARRFWLG